MLFAISGGDDLTIHEIQEAAKIITESIDKDAKVIFGTIHDDKLKKGEIKVTVIATSFPSDMPRTTLFAGTNETKQTQHHQPQPALVKDETPAIVKKEIHNTIQQQQNTPKNDFIKKPPTVVEDIIDDDNNDEWSAVPAFLRRKKN